MTFDNAPGRYFLAHMYMPVDAVGFARYLSFHLTPWFSGIVSCILGYGASG